MGPTQRYEGGGGRHTGGTGGQSHIPQGRFATILELIISLRRRLFVCLFVLCQYFFLNLLICGSLLLICHSFVHATEDLIAADDLVAADDLAF